MKNKKKLVLILICSILLISIVVSSLVFFSPKDNTPETPTSLGEKQITFMHEPTSETEKKLVEVINNTTETGMIESSFYGEGNTTKFYYLKDEEFNFFNLNDFVTVAHITVPPNQNERISFLTYSGKKNDYNKNNVTKEKIKSDIEIATNFLGVPYTSISINNDADNDNGSKEDIPENKYDNFDLVTEKDLEYMCNNDSYICITYSVSKDIQYIFTINVYDDNCGIALTMIYDLSLQV